jgi:hypothetical protein
LILASALQSFEAVSIVDWEAAVKGATKGQDIENTMKSIYPDRIGDYISLH